MTAPAAGNVSTAPVLLPLVGIVRDPALQFRADVNADVVEAYAEAIREGSEFPPIRCYRIGEVVKVVDGWHRLAAAEAAGQASIAAIVVEGSERAALLEAARANATHGLPRSADDKRRAVRRLLMDLEWCALSSRELATLAGVTHTYVNNLRKRYDVARGEALTEARMLLVDNEPPPVWAALLKRAPSWQTEKIEAIRIAPSLPALLPLRRDAYSDAVREALTLREGELSTNVWPWEDDQTPADRAARADGLDQAADLYAALGAAECPERAKLWQVLSDLDGLERRTWRLDTLINEWAGRPALLQAARVRALELEAKARTDATAADSDPYAWRNGIYALGAEEQERALRAEQDPERLRLIEPRSLRPSVRDGYWRSTLADAVPCPDPRCSGWWTPSGVHRCVVCGGYTPSMAGEIVDALLDAVSLLGTDGVGVVLPDGRVLERRGLALLGLIAADVAASVGRDGRVPAWFGRVPAELRAALLEWAPTIDARQVAPTFRLLPDPHGYLEPDGCQRHGGDGSAADCTCMATGAEGEIGEGDERVSA